MGKVIMVAVSHYFALISFFCIWTTGDATTCYICSWSPKEQNQTDHCLPDNFKPEMIRYIECQHGCEFVTEWDKSGEMINFFRNCANDQVSAEKKCQKFIKKDISRTVCSCNWYTCNRAPASLLCCSSVLLFVLFIRGLILWDSV